MPNRVGKCINFGNCSKADSREPIEVAPDGEFVCPEADGGCGKPLEELHDAHPNRGVAKSISIAAVVLVIAALTTVLVTHLRNLKPETPAPVVSTPAPSTPPPDPSPSASSASKSDEPDPKAVLLTASFKNGMGYASNRDYTNAIKEFQSVEKKDPTFTGLQMNMGAAYLAMGNYAAAKEHLEAARRQSPDDPNVLYNLACLAAMTETPTVALEKLQAAVDHGFHNVAALKSDAELASVRKRKEFAAVVQAASRQ